MRQAADTTQEHNKQQQCSNLPRIVGKMLLQRDGSYRHSLEHFSSRSEDIHPCSPRANSSSFHTCFRDRQHCISSVTHRPSEYCLICRQLWIRCGQGALWRPIGRHGPHLLASAFAPAWFSDLSISVLAGDHGLYADGALQVAADRSLAACHVPQPRRPAKAGLRGPQLLLQVHPDKNRHALQLMTAHHKRPAMYCNLEGRPAWAIWADLLLQVRL